MVRVDGSKFSFFVLLFVFVGQSFAQTFIKEGRIVFERRTNLEKRFEGMEESRWMRNVDLSKPQVDEFELLFDDTTSLFRPILDEVGGGMSEWLTMKNTTYQSLTESIRKQEFSFFGTKVLLEDSIRKRTWRMTQSSREIAGYNCRQALWEVNDTLRIYAWYAEELIPPLGPETFNGLPGLILGLAIEDGGVVYFAKDIDIKATKEIIEGDKPKGRKKDWYSEEQLKALMEDRFSQMGSAVDRIAMDVFVW